MIIRETPREGYIFVETILGREGGCLSVDNLRVAGPKPWGGGQVEKQWEVKISDLERIMRDRGYLVTKEEQKYDSGS
jgi:hypothetical protein